MPKLQTTLGKYKPTKRTQIPDEFRPSFLDGLDGRTNVAKELKARLAALESDLGGSEILSYQQKSLCLRAIHLEARIQAMEVALAQGEHVETGCWIQAINSLIGLYKSLGLEKRSKEVIDLHSYIRKRSKE